MKTMKHAFYCLVLILSACANKSDDGVPYPSEDQLAESVTGFSREWTCIGRRQEGSTDLLVTTLLRKDDGSGYLFTVRNRVVTHSASGFGISTYGGGEWREDIDVTSSDSNSFTVFAKDTFDPIANYKKSERTLLLMKSPVSNGPLGIDCAKQLYEAHSPR